jgi:hypothetical protein
LPWRLLYGWIHTEGVQEFFPPREVVVEL